MIAALNWIMTFLRNTNPVVTSVFVGASAVGTVWQLFSSLWPTLFARIDALTVNATGGALSFQPCGLINAIFPLAELLNFLVAYGALRLAAAGIRIVKSFVPTIA
ncbi:MAG: hypothetical protein HYV96_00920 [Opitutae bacterium]|nr:hypothetical protein [Opitutae bacterium]